MAQIPSSGNVVVDQLQGLQREIAAIPKRKQRLSYVSQKAHDLPLEQLIDQQFVVATRGLVVARGPEDVSGWGRTYEKLDFIGEASSFHYERYKPLGVEGLVMKFVYPIIMTGVERQQARDCHELTLRVPILAITSCVERVPVEMDPQ